MPPPPEAIRALLGQLRDLPTQASSDLDGLEQARGRIAELERALRERPIEVRTETVVERIEVPTIDAGTVHCLELLVATLRDTGAELVSVGDRLVAGLAQVRDGTAPVPSHPEPAPRPRIGRAPGAHRALPRTTAPGPPAPSDGLSAPQQRILDALAAFEAVGLDQVAKSNVATWARQSPTSSGFTNNLGALRSLGLIDYPQRGQVMATDLLFPELPGPAVRQHRLTPRRTS